MQVLLHNEWSLVLFAEYLASRRRGPRRRRLAVDTIAQYVGMAKKELSVRFGFAIAGDPQRLPHVIRAMRRERPRQQRSPRRGLRGRPLREARRQADEARRAALLGRADPNNGAATTMTAREQDLRLQSPQSCSRPQDHQGRP